MRPFEKGRALQMENGADSKSWLIGKILGVWGLVGITSWSEAASFAAFCLTMWILGRHVWRDALRPIGERFGWLNPLTQQQLKEEAAAGGDDAGAI